MGLALSLLLAAALLAAAPAQAQQRKPPVPPGRDPGGVAVALLTTGIDYRLPALAGRLARDGEGELIGWDLVDGDRQPFDAAMGTAPPERGGDGTALAMLLLAAGGVRLVPVRVDPGAPVSFARALAFVARTPARIALMPMWGRERQDWEPVRQAAERFAHVLVIAAPEAGEAAYPDALSLDSLLAVEGAGSGAEAAGFGGRTQRLAGAHAALAAAGRAAAALLAREPGLDTGALKRRLVQAGGDGEWRPLAGERTKGGRP